MPSMPRPSTRPAATTACAGVGILRVVQVFASMRNSRKLLSLALLSLALPSCATTNLARWVWDAPSAIDEPHGSVSAAVLKPGVTVIGMPVAVAWDVATLPFQAIFGVYPYGNWHMTPDAR